MASGRSGASFSGKEPRSLAHRSAPDADDGPAGRGAGKRCRPQSAMRRPDAPSIASIGSSMRRVRTPWGVRLYLRRDVGRFCLCRLRHRRFCAAYRRLACLAHGSCRLRAGRAGASISGLAGDFYVVIAKIAESNLIGITAAMAALLLLIGLWYGFPLAMLAARQRTSRCPERSARA